MNAEWKQRWIAALRSGKYKQNRYALRKGDAFCCLGVLCDIYDNSKWEEEEGGRIHLYNLERGKAAGSYPPAKVMKEVGITIDRCQKLADMNDGYGSSFSDIANFIEENL